MSSCVFRGPPGLMTPYVRQYCFQPSFVSGPDVRSCTTGWSARGACMYNDECKSSDVCSSGKCGVFDSANPQITSTLPDGTYLVDNQGTSTPMVALGDRNQPQCSTCLKTVWQCDRFKDTDPASYAKCQQLKNCFLYDVVRPGGSMIPVGVKNTPECRRASEAAAQKCITRCGDCVPQPMSSTGKTSRGLW